MFSVEECNLPVESLLQEYRKNGAYTDCYSTVVDRRVSQSEFVRAFYTTVPFKLERLILKWLVSKPSTDEDARRLAEARTESFSAWHVEQRRDHQILLSDYRGRTRSWLMSKPTEGKPHDSTHLYFGSAVVPTDSAAIKERQTGRSFSALLLFHKLYSQILLASARSRTCSEHLSPIG